MTYRGYLSDKSIFKICLPLLHSLFEKKALCLIIKLKLKFEVVKEIEGIFKKSFRFYEIITESVLSSGTRRKCGHLKMIISHWIKTYLIVFQCICSVFVIFDLVKCTDLFNDSSSL